MIVEQPNKANCYYAPSATTKLAQRHIQIRYNALDSFLVHFLNPPFALLRTNIGNTHGGENSPAPWCAG